MISEDHRGERTKLTSDQEIGERCLCFECVGEAFLRSMIEKDGHLAVCSYCGGSRNAFSVEKMADIIDLAFEQHFDRTATEPSGIDYVMSNESDYDWEREGEPVMTVIANCAEIDDKVAEDIREVLGGRYNKQGDHWIEEDPFDSEAYYAEKSVDDAAFWAAWRHFEQSLRIEARYSTFRELNLPPSLIPCSDTGTSIGTSSSNGSLAAHPKKDLSESPARCLRGFGAGRACVLAHSGGFGVGRVQETAGDRLNRVCRRFTVETRFSQRSFACYVSFPIVFK
jgi:hypothetical protein